MFPKEFAPYVIALLVVALLARRVVKAQRPRTVKVWRLWLLPAILVLSTGLTLANEPAPGLVALAAFLVAAVAGGAFGWFRVHTLEFSIDPETREISSKATPFGAMLLIGLLAFRYAMKYALHLEGVNGVNLIRWTDGALIFTAALVAAQSAHTWVQARRLLAEQAPAPISSLPK